MIRMRRPPCGRGTATGSGSCCSPSCRSRSQKKMTGVTISTWSSDETMPPSTGVASGFITSAPDTACST